MGFSDDMKTMCETLAQSRSDREKAMEELHSDFSRDRTERKSGLKRLFGDVHVMIQHFHSDRGKMSKELRQMLKAFYAGVRKEGEQSRKERIEFCHAIEREVGRMLKEFRTQHKAMSGKQRQELMAFRTSLARDVKALMNQLRERIEEIAGQSQAVRKEARGMIREYRADFKKARGYWMAFAERMQRARRTGRPAPSRMKAGPMARIMEALKGSPEGMTPKELSYAVGMPEKSLRQRLMRMRREGSIRKRKSTFFAK